MAQIDLNAEFYYDSAGEQIGFLQRIGNCFTRNVYFFLRQYIDPHMLMKAYVDDFSTRLHIIPLRQGAFIGAK
ncbi:hypothetical protein V3851_03875 [Paenibacillus sp. M1]|uniref:Uncharacterized protein n=1 Tax=Paenibacillus haidiansis TaxID=1574488 RepID=A0ABU7VMG6_9BACL